MPGCFVAFEGTEGSGKTSQLRRVAAWLSAGLDVVITREPGGTPTAEAIRELVLNLPDDAREPATDALLMSAARNDLCRRVIAPALERGAVVLSDRFAASTRAYQGAGDGLADEWLVRLEQLATGGITPDRSVLLDLQVEHGLERRHRDGDVNAMDRRGIAFHRRVRDGYLKLAEATPERWTVLHADRPADAVWVDVQSAVGAVLRSRGMEPPACG